MTFFVRNLCFSLTVGWLSFLAGYANADLISVDYTRNSGDNLITRDTEAGLEWLDVNLTAGQTFDQVRTGIWYQRGFRYATKDELQILFLHAGTPDDDFDVSTTYPAETLALAQLLGPTLITGSRVSVAGFTSTDFFGNQITLQNHPVGAPFSALLGKVDYLQSYGEAHFTGGHPFSDQADVTYGSFLVRAYTPSPLVSGKSPTNDSTPTWSWISGGGKGVFRYKLDPTSIWSTKTTATSFTPLEPLADGRYILCVQEKDADGKWSATGKKMIVVDTIPPTPPVINATSPTETPTWSWNTTTYRYKLDDNNLETGATESTQTEFTPALNSLSAGTHILYVQKRDAAGNWSASAEKAVEVLPPSDYKIHNDGTVTSLITGLMWQQQDDSTTRNWQSATDYCENLELAGHTNWRLPTISELQYIILPGNSPAIDMAVFPNPLPSFYWSSTIWTTNNSYAWIVYFYDGYVIPYGINNDFYTRCVRDGQ